MIELIAVPFGGYERTGNQAHAAAAHRVCELIAATTAPLLPDTPSPLGPW